MALNIVPTVKRGWKPGQSGNPGGRARERSLQELCRTHTEEAVRQLIIAMRDPKDRVPAAIAILDRGWGKPKQVIEAAGEVTHIQLHLLAAQAISDEIIARQQQRTTIDAEPVQQKAPSDLLSAPPPTE